MQEIIKNLSFIGLLMLGSAWSAPRHGFHSSLAEMSYHAKTKSFQIVLTLFADDTEEALTKYDKKRYSLGSFGKNRAPDALMLAYLSEHFVLLDKKQKKASIKYIGKEVQASTTIVYFEIPFTEDLNGATLYNTLMLELFDDQSNIVNVSKKEKSKSFYFSLETTKHTITNL